MPQDNENQALHEEKEPEPLAIKLGCVEVGIEVEGREEKSCKKSAWCGIRVLTKEEAEQGNDGLPFKMEELERYPQIETENPEEARKHKDHLKNVKILAANLLAIMKTPGFKKKYEEMQTFSYFAPPPLGTAVGEKGEAPQEAAEAAAVEKKEEDTHPPQASPVELPSDPLDTKYELHCAEIIAYTENLSRKRPGKVLGVLNPANRRNLGGGAFIGANALEEIFFRCSDFAFALIKYAWGKDGFQYKYYLKDAARPDYQTELQEGEAWFTPAVTFTQRPPPEKPGEYQLCDPFTVAVITSAAPIYGNVRQAQSDPGNESIIKREIRAQLIAAKEGGVHIPVLTAFGCGAFNNDPRLVGRYYAEVLYKEGYACYFEEIHFAIWRGPLRPKADNNFGFFGHAFEEAVKKIKLDKVARELEDALKAHDGNAIPAPQGKEDNSVADKLEERRNSILDQLGTVVAKEIKALLLSPSLSLEDTQDLTKAFELANAVIENPGDLTAINNLRTYALEVAQGKPVTWKKLGGALMALAGGAMLVFSITCIPLSGGTSLMGLYVANALLMGMLSSVSSAPILGGSYLFCDGLQKGLSKALCQLADAASNPENIKPRQR
ncbi:MAG: hypothetical protein K0S27_1568 [Gammaproteobacteria bacterium]|jgi:uncharacterized protein (TIGR02452 family)|nr:hypothetical protein [Gammaproteobacteria bacterium]